jgi:hypothetical protein
MTGFIDTFLQLDPTIIAQNRWLSQTRSISYWTKRVCSSTVTDLVLIYESTTSSSSVVGWLTINSWTLNSLTKSEWRIIKAPYERITTELSWTEPTSRRTECRSPCLSVPLLFCFYPLPRKHVLASRWLELDYSWFQASCHNMQACLE